MLPKDYEKFITNSVVTDPKLKLPPEYYKFTDVFKYKSEFTLLDRKPSINYAINLKPNSKPLYKRGFTINPM
jgi:hypothetical protein